MNNALLKRFLSVVMAVAMVMSLVVIPVAADEVDGGTSCTEHEYVNGVCECGATEPKSECNHANKQEDVTPATCTEDGSKTVACGDCGETISTEIIGKLGHTYGEGGKCECGAEKPAEEEPAQCVCQSKCGEVPNSECPVCQDGTYDGCVGKTVEKIEAEQKAAADAAKVEEVNDLIAALPETVTAENYESVMAQLTTIMGHQESMGELWSKVDQAKLEAVIAATQNLAPTPEEPSATIGHGLQTIVDASKPRESVTTTLENVHAKNELKVELYSAGTLLSTTTLRQADLDDATAKYPANGEYTVNIVLSGQASGSWDTTWHVTPTASNIPDTIKVYADGALKDTKTNTDGYFLNATEKSEYLALDALIPRVAFIGETGYKTLEEAINASQTGETVTIKVDGTYKLPQIDKNLTIKAAEGVTATFDDIGTHKTGSGSITFENLIFDYYPNTNYTGLQHSSSLTYNNCTINGQVFLYGTSETFNNCTFHQNSADNYNVWTYGAKKVTFADCTFNCAGKSVLVYNEGACATEVTVTNSKFIASQAVEDKAAIEIGTNLMPDGTKIVIDGATTATGFANGSVSGDPLWNDKEDQTNLAVFVAGAQVWPIYPVSVTTTAGTQGFKTLAEALNYADTQTGEVTITLNKDISETVTITQKEGLSLIINGGDYVYSGKIAVKGGNRYEGAETLTFQNMKFQTANEQHIFIDATGKDYPHNVIVENCSFTGTGSSYKGVIGVKVRQGNNFTVRGCTADKVFYLIQNTSGGHNLTVENSTVTNGLYAVNVDTCINAVIRNVTISSQAYGIVLKGGNNTTTTLENVTVTTAMDRAPVYLRKADNENSGRTYTVAVNGANTFNSGDVDGDWLLIETDGSVEVILNDTALTSDGIDKVVAQIGNTYYNKLNYAINDAGEGATLILHEDGVVNADTLATIAGKRLNVNGNGNLIKAESGSAAVTAVDTMKISGLGKNGVGMTLGAGDKVTFDAEGNMKIEPAYDSNAGYGAVEVTYMKNGKLATETFALKKDAYLSMTKDGILTVVGGDDHATTLPYTLKPHMNEYTFVQYSSTTLTYVSNMFFDTFDEAYLDGMKLVPSKDFIAAPGSTYITLTNAKLRTLRLGDHSLYIVGKDGIRSEIAVVRVIASPYVADTTNPKTGDSIFLALSVMLFTGCALAVIPFTLKKKIH